MIPTGHNLANNASGFFSTAPTGTSIFRIRANRSACSTAISAAKIATEFGDRGKEEGRAHLQAGGIMKRWKLGNGRKIQHYTGGQAGIDHLNLKGFGTLVADAVTLQLTKLPAEAITALGAMVETKLSKPSILPVKG